MNKPIKANSVKQFIEQRIGITYSPHNCPTNLTYREIEILMQGFADECINNALTTKNLLHEFFNRASDACPLECEEQETMENEWEEWMRERLKS